MLITRRRLLQDAGVSCLLGWSALRSLALETSPASQERQPTLVLLFLRGGADGLNLLVPHGEAAYYRLRPGIGIGRPAGEGTAIDLDGFFGLHPAASELESFFRAGSAACLPALGSASNTRSHFEEQDRWETGVDASEVSTSGWLSRHLSTSRGRGPLRALSLGQRLPRSLRGEVNAISVRGLDQLAFPDTGGGNGSTLEALARAYAEDDARALPSGLTRAGHSSLQALSELRAVLERSAATQVTYPDTDLGRRARDAARLIRAEVGLEVIEIDVDGWDTHQNQGGAYGSFADKVRQVSGALAALMRDLESRLDDVLILTVTEFGRTAAQNGTNGTDHGWASCALAMGGPVLRAAPGRDGVVVGRWPGLEREQLHQGRDLAHTAEFRDLYAEVLGFLGNTQIESVLPGHAPSSVGLIPV